MSVKPRYYEPDTDGSSGSLAINLFHSAPHGLAGSACVLSIGFGEHSRPVQQEKIEPTDANLLQRGVEIIKHALADVCDLPRVPRQLMADTDVLS